MKAAGKAERWVAAALPTLLGAGVFAVAAVHTVEVARWAGQPLWSAVLIAATGEAMAIAAVLEVRYRQRHGMGIVWPLLVLASAVAFSAACNLTGAVVERGADGLLTGDPGDWRPAMAVWPVAAFALVAGTKATRKAKQPAAGVPFGTPGTNPVPEPALSVPDAVPAPVPPAQAPRGQRRHALAELVAGVPADDPRSAAALARDLGPRVGLKPGTARRYLSELRTEATS